MRPILTHSRQPGPGAQSLRSSARDVCGPEGNRATTARNPGSLGCQPSKSCLMKLPTGWRRSGRHAGKGAHAFDHCSAILVPRSVWGQGSGLAALSWRVPGPQHLQALTSTPIRGLLDQCDTEVREYKEHIRGALGVGGWTQSPVLLSSPYQVFTATSILNTFSVKPTSVLAFAMSLQCWFGCNNGGQRLDIPRAHAAHPADPVHTRREVSGHGSTGLFLLFVLFSRVWCTRPSGKFPLV